LGVFLASAFSGSELPSELEVQAHVDFVTDSELRSVLSTTSVTSE
jgi:hypothetical protein